MSGNGELWQNIQENVIRKLVTTSALRQAFAKRHESIVIANIRGICVYVSKKYIIRVIKTKKKADGRKNILASSSRLYGHIGIRRTTLIRNKHI